MEATRAKAHLIGRRGTGRAPKCRASASVRWVCALDNGDNYVLCAIQRLLWRGTCNEITLGAMQTVLLVVNAECPLCSAGAHSIDAAPAFHFSRRSLSLGCHYLILRGAARTLPLCGAEGTLKADFDVLP
jgi:hypothetical protein